MTGRTCPVHGEYSASGACRWCEPSEPVNLPGLKGLWQKPDGIEVNEAGVPTYTFVLTEKTKEAYRWRLTMPLRDWLRAPPSWRMEYADPARVIAANFEEEARLAKEHAALRWERVARRWNYKHRGGGEGEEGRAYVWRWWLEQMDRQSAGLPLAGPFPLGFYAW